MVKLRPQAADTPAGTKVNPVVIRDGKRMPFSVTLKDKDDRTAVATPDAP